MPNSCDLGPSAAHVDSNGNDVDTDACTQFCKPAACGDGFLQDGELCDEGSTDDSGACLSTCVPAECGDGHLHVDFEQCDNGGDNNNDTYDGCTTACVPGPSCGDMIVNGPEQCDDGTPDGDDLCNACVEAPRRYVFVTSMAFNGKFNGLNGADAQCTLIAGSADLGPLNAKWVAWLSDDTNSAASRMDTTYTGWYAVPGAPALPVAKGWSGLSSGTLLNPISKTETGSPLAPGESAWSNTSTNGGILTLDQHCGNWASNFGFIGRRGDPSATDSEWTARWDGPCDHVHHLYCVEN